ncbi:MAG TPA: DUF3054 domain-containing protein [Terrimesophilobacter sp.]|jgi:Protein of unknown function (DUF3054).|uniref:DUF3054 domain-containing protein n=1 Tax=Terrimesophilobacter sp. TaxID=2906435 RepID=UPI002F95B3E6
MGTERMNAGSVVVAAAVDVIVVLVFALVGRASHNEGVLGLFGTAWPFLAGLALGWLGLRAWRHPYRTVWTGIGIWIATVAGGMALRVVSGQTAQLPFVLVATGALGVLLVGWRAMRLLMIRARHAGH